MAKILRTCLQEDVQRDHINRLPDDIIINILSRLPLKEVCISGFVSRRFDKLWILSIYPNIKSELDFLPLWKLYFNKLDDELSSSWPEFAPIVERKRHLFVSLLKKVLKSYQQPVVNEIVINFYLNSSFSNFIDDLVKFAFSKGVKRLHLDFCSVLQWESPYVFPSLDKFFSSTTHNVRDVRLKYVSIDQEAVDCLLSTCPLLERLHLLSEKLSTLKITGDTLKLKHLEMEGCNDAELIEISAPNLVSLCYTGNESALHISNAPLLSEFCSKKLYRTNFFQGFDSQYRFLFQLKILKLYIYSGFWTFTHQHKEKLRYEELCRGIREATKFSHKFLKVVEMSEFKGLSSEIEFAQHLFDIDAPSLEKVVISTRTPCFEKVPQDQIDKAKDIARSLCKGLDSSVHIDIL